MRYHGLTACMVTEEEAHMSAGDCTSDCNKMYRLPVIHMFACLHDERQVSQAHACGTVFRRACLLERAVTDVVDTEHCGELFRTLKGPRVNNLERLLPHGPFVFLGEQDTFHFHGAAACTFVARSTPRKAPHHPPRARIA